MSNQLQITGGAKVRNLQGVITGTSGVLGALGINVPDGIPQLDGSGKILVSQLPNSVMEYKGTWNAATNTPTLANGTGNAGDVYICEVAGTVNFGAGPITFYVGDQVIYSGTIWQRASGSSGTVSSVSITESGDSLNITGSPITTSGTINIGFNGNSGQYINGAGNLTTFPSLTGYVPYTGATTDVDLGIHVLNAQALHVKGTAGAGHLGLKHQSAAATGSANESLIYANVDGDLAWKNDNLYLTTLNTHANTADRTYTFPNASGTLALTSDLSSYVPTSRTIITTAPLQGGGDLSANRTLSITQASASTNGYLSSTDWNTFNNKQSAITNPVTGVGSADSVAYWNSSSNITYDSTFYYSSSNKRLGVNTNTPNATIGGNIAIDGGYGLLVKNADNNYNGLGIGIDSTYGNLIASQKLGTASARNVTILNQSGYHSLTEAGSFGLNILTPTASPSGVGSVGIDVYGGSNAAGIGFHNVASGVGNTNGAYLYLTNALSLTLRNLEGTIVSSSLGDFSVITNSTENFRVNASNGSLWQSNITSAVLKANSSNVIVAAVAGTDYQAPITLTTTGSSGAATFSSNTLNVPNYTLSGLGGVPTSRTLTINGTAYDLSADRSWSVGTLTGGGADGRVAFWNGASNVVSDSLFVWDDTNNRLGIGLVNPQRALEIYSTSPDTHLKLSGAAPSVSMGEAITGGIYQAKFGLATASNQFVTGSVAGDFVISNQTGSTIWAYNSTEKMRLDTNGNLGVGGIANSSYRLHVFGTGTMLGIETTAASNVYLRMLQAGTVVGGMYYNNSDSTLRINNNNGGLRFDTSTVNGALNITSGGVSGFGVTPASQNSGAYVGSAEFGGIVRIQGSGGRYFTSGNGLEFSYNSIYSYNRGTSAYNDLSINDTMVVKGGNGNVGIGTSSPSALLTLAKDNNIGINTVDGTDNGYLALCGAGADGEGRGGHIYLSGNERAADAGTVVLSAGNVSTGAVLFRTGAGSERMRITSGGQVTIQTPTSGVSLLAYGKNNEWTIQSEGSTTVGQSYGMYISAGSNSSDQSFSVNSYNKATNYFKVRGDGLIQAQGVYNNTTSAAANVWVDTDGSLRRSTSSLKYKKNVKNYTKGLKEIMQIRPVTYEGKSEVDEGKIFAGLIAEEVHDLGLTEFVQYAEDGTPDALAYQNMIALAFKAIQELSAKVTELENKLK